MKRNIKTTFWVIAAIILLLGCIIVGHHFMNSPLTKRRFILMIAENVLQIPH